MSPLRRLTPFEMHWRPRWNDVVRGLLGICLIGLGRVLSGAFMLRVKLHAWQQRRLRARYHVAPETLIHRYDDTVKAELEAIRRKLGPKAIIAETSGSTHEPKRIVYTRARVEETKWVFTDVYARYMSAIRLAHHSMYIFAPLAADASLTSVMLRERRLPGAGACLLTPHRVEVAPELAPLVTQYGSLSVRLWLLTVANPALLYATNPSTLASFFSGVSTRWDEARALSRAWVRDEKVRRLLCRVFLRICSVGAAERVAAIAAGEAPLEVSAMLPRLEVFSSWDGGYVQPFLEAVRRHLPAESFGFWPMYSMSTETVETVGTWTDGSFAFLPLAPGVLYEFLPETSGDDSEHLLTSEQLVPGQTYALVVSDGFGLRRYQTEDLFRCVRRVGGLPDLRFVRRRNLSYSFTGEKLTGEQVRSVFSDVAKHLPPAAATGFLTCIPTAPGGVSVPGYKIVFVHEEPSAPLPTDLAMRIQNALCAMNSELAAKIESGRLAAFQLERLTREQLVRAIGGDAAVSTWEAQFKFLPLYTKPWEELCFH